MLWQLVSNENIMSVAWIPLKVELGALPSCSGATAYELQGIPPDAKEVLIYTFITTKGEGGEFQRGWYEFSTDDGTTEFKQYMNVATGQGVNIVNSANMWFPVPPNYTLTVKLDLMQDGNKHIAGKLAASQPDDWSKVFIIGYRC